MKQIETAGVLLFILFAITGNSFGQNDAVGENSINMRIPQVSLISFEGGERMITHESENDGQINQVITSPQTETWINYASIVEEGTKNEITVQISSGYLPPDVDVKIQPGAYAGEGKGEIGDPVSEVTLSRYPKTIITNIGSCYTGKGVNNGHKLVYSWETDEEVESEKLSKKNYSITVTYTIKSAL